MKVRPSKCQLALLFLLSMAVMACTANDEKRAMDLSAASDHCSGFSEFRLPHAVITQAQLVASGDFVLYGSDFWIEYIGKNVNTDNLPAFCRVQAVAVPTQDSHIKMEIWMPAKNWNGRYYQFAMGGAAGSLDYTMLVQRLSEGNAVATTDTGHMGKQLDWSWALGHPEKIIDFGYRAHKETSDIAKAIVAQYYTRKPDYAYFFGCSRGGHAGLVSAQRYPDDWDGILVGAAPADVTKELSNRLWRSLKWAQDPQGRIEPTKLPAIQRAARASCTAEAHRVDGIPADPRFCRYDPAILLCKGEETDACLTAPQIETLREIYDGQIDPITEKNQFRVPPTMEAVNKVTAEYKAAFEKVAGRFSLEAGDARWVTNYGFSVEDFFRNVVFHDREWDITKVKLDDMWSLAKDKMVAGEKLEDVLKADIDWKALSKTNTKLMMYYGWADGFLSELGIEHYKKALDQIGDEAKTQDFLRLFMVPGHCSRGPGAHIFGQYNRKVNDEPSHNIVRALEAWVEQGVAPEKLIATKYVDDFILSSGKEVSFTRPLCVYPNVPVYIGQGSTKEAANFQYVKGARP